MTGFSSTGALLDLCFGLKILFRALIGSVGESCPSLLSPCLESAWVWLPAASVPSAYLTFFYLPEALVSCPVPGVASTPFWALKSAPNMP